MKDSLPCASLLLNVKHGGGKEGFQIAQMGILLGILLPLTLDGASALPKQKKKTQQKSEWK